MSASENIAINFVTSFQGKGIQQGQQSLSGFESLAKKAAATIAGLFSVDKVIAFGKASVQAFTEDQKALALLDQTMKNVGLSLSSADANKFIDSMSNLYGVAKEQLIPAFQTLIRYTGSVGQSQKLTQLAMDISAGTGKDLTTVTTALGKAYGGQYTALGKLGTGISKNILDTKNFTLVQNELTRLFKGDAATAAETYQGKIDRLKVGFHDMEVQIGEGLVNALTSLAASGGSVDNAITSFQNLGAEINNDIADVTKLIGWMEKIPGFQTAAKSAVSTTLNSIFVWKPFQNLFDSLTKTKEKAQKATSGESDYTLTIAKTLQAQKAAAKIADDNAKAAAAAASAAKKKLDLQAQDNALAKASLALKQSQKVFDQQAAELWAATHSKQTDADQARLQLMNDQAALQDAIDQKDATLATNLAARVKQDQLNIQSMQTAINSIGTDDNPLQALNDALNQGYATLQKMVAAYQILMGGSNSTSVNPLAPQGVDPDGKFANTLSMASTANPSLLQSGLPAYCR